MIVEPLVVIEGATVWTVFSVSKKTCPKLGVSFNELKNKEAQGAGQNQPVVDSSPCGLGLTGK
jgi:hypothetical protein